MKRREFLAAAATTLVPVCPFGGAFLCPTDGTLADELPRDIKVTRIVGFDLISRRSKLAGKNSRRDVHGDRARDRMVRIFTSTGAEGLGNCRAESRVLAGLLGKNPFDLYRPSQRRVIGPLGTQTMPLWDLAGKLLGTPVFELLGGKGPERVPVYDGSIYFADLLPQYVPRWKDRLREEIDIGLRSGHRAFKIKIGRGAKWMDRAEGDARDIEVIRVIREHAGRDAILGVDANNGYDLAGTKQSLSQIGQLSIAFVEEMFPEEVDQCLDLKQFVAGRGWNTLLADGETQADLEVFKPFIQAKAIDVLQADMNRFGFEGILTEAAWAKPQGILVAPHNWGSLVGFYMQLHVGRAISNFYRAEHDPLFNDLLIADGYQIRSGTSSVPDAPGFGLRINEEEFSRAKINFDLKG